MGYKYWASNTTCSHRGTTCVVMKHSSFAWYMVLSSLGSALFAMTLTLLCVYQVSSSSSSSTTSVPGSAKSWWWCWRRERVTNSGKITARGKRNREAIQRELQQAGVSGKKADVLKIRSFLKDMQRVEVAASDSGMVLPADRRRCVAHPLPSSLFVCSFCGLSPSRLSSNLPPFLSVGRSETI